MVVSVSVHMLGGQEHSFTVNGKSTFLDLKRCMRQRTGANKNFQHLICDDSMLTNGDDLVIHWAAPPDWFYLTDIVAAKFVPLQLKLSCVLETPHCDACNKQLNFEERITFCSGCYCRTAFFVVYCSQTCQMCHWPAHMKVCKPSLAPV